METRPQEGPHQREADSGAKGQPGRIHRVDGEGGPATGLHSKDPPRLHPLPHTHLVLKALKHLSSLRIKMKTLLVACRALRGRLAWPLLWPHRLTSLWICPGVHQPGTHQPLLPQDLAPRMLFPPLEPTLLVNSCSSSR